MTVRVGIIGAGFAASAHADALGRVPGAELVAVAGISMDEARAGADRFGAALAFGDYRELLADDTVDAVHNCTPNNVHAAVTTEALQAGKHVLCEKPLGMDSNETAALVEEAAAADVVTGVCFNYRHYPLVGQARVMLRSGEIGAAHLVHGGYLQDWLLFDTDWNWRLESERGGVSRAVADIGSHWMDLIQHVTGDRIAEVFASLGTLHTERVRPAGDVLTFAQAGRIGERVPIDTEDWGMVLFRTAGGLSGTFTVSQVSAGWKNRLFFEIDAANGSLAWDQEEPNVLRIGRRDGPNAVLPRDPGLLAPEAAALAHFPGGHQEGWPDGLKNLFLDFYATVAAAQGGEPHEGSFATFVEAHRVVQAVEAIMASHRSGRWIAVGSEQGVAT